MREEDARIVLHKIGKHLAQRGLAPGTSGNLSVRLDDGRMLMTPTNSSLGELDPKSLAILDAGSRHTGGAAPTKERFLHAAVYQMRPDFRAVVHLHSTYAVAYSCLRGLKSDDALPPVTAYTVMRLGRVALIPYIRPGDERLGEAVGHAALQHHAMLLANHGTVVAAASLEAAAAAAEESEQSARLLLLLHGHDVRLLSDEEVDELRRTFGS